MWLIFLQYFYLFLILLYKLGRKRPLDTPKRMIERRERERKKSRRREIEREGEIRERERERDVKGIGVKGIERGKG